MSSLNKLRQLAGIPIDYSKVNNASASVRIPANVTSSLNEAAKVPQHRGELAPKTKDNMKARVNHAKKALEALELAREELMELPAIDYMEDIPDVIKQLHHMLHGDDGTGGMHHLHRHYKNEFDNTVFPEDIEEDRLKDEEERQAAEAGITGDEPDTSKKKKKTNEAMGFSVGFTKQSKEEPSDGKKNVRPFKLADGSDKKTMYQEPDQEEEIGEDPAERNEADPNVMEASKKPKWLEKKEVEAEKKEGKKVNKSEEKKVGVKEGSIDPSIAKIASAHHAWRNKKAAEFDPSHLETDGRHPAEMDVKAADRQHPEEEEDGDYDCDTCGGTGQVMNRAYGKEETCNACMGRGSIPNNEVEDDKEEEQKSSRAPIKRCPDCGEFGEMRGHMGCQYPSDEEDCSDMVMPMESAKSKKPKWLEKAEVKAEEKAGKKVSPKEKKKVNEKITWKTRAELAAEEYQLQEAAKKVKPAAVAPVVVAPADAAAKAAADAAKAADSKAPAATAPTAPAADAKPAADVKPTAATAPTAPTAPTATAAPAAAAPTDTSTSTGGAKTGTSTKTSTSTSTGGAIASRTTGAATGGAVTITISGSSRTDTSTTTETETETETATGGKAGGKGGKGGGGKGSRAADTSATGNTGADKDRPNIFNITVNSTGKSGEAIDNSEDKPDGKIESGEKQGENLRSKNETKSVQEASGPLFARDGQHPKHNDEEKYSSWGPSNKPVNVVSDEEPSIYYPNGAKRENANQLSTNPYNENQKVTVPTKIKSSLKTEADTARKLAETFTMRKDWDSKNFHENLANAFDTLNGFLEKGTVYGIKEAQVFMTSLMGPILHKIPADVVKYVAAGGTQRSLKSYVNDVKAPVTSPDVFQQDSNGVK